MHSLATTFYCTVKVGKFQKQIFVVSFAQKTNIFLSFISSLASKMGLSNQKKGRHFIIKIRWYIFNIIEAFIFYLTNFKYLLRAEIKKWLLMLILEVKGFRKFASEIYWSLAKFTIPRQYISAKIPTWIKNFENIFHFQITT